MRIRPSFAGALCLSVALPCSLVRAQGEVLTNEALVQMVTAKVNKAVILTKIQTTPNTFDVTVRGLAALSRSKVPADVINAAMLRTRKDRSDAAKEVLTNGDVVEMSSAGGRTKNRRVELVKK